MSTLSNRTPSNAASDAASRPVGQGRIREAQARVATLTRKLREARGSRSRGVDVEQLQAELTAAEREVSRLRRQAVVAQRDATQDQRAQSFEFDREHPAMELPAEVLDRLIQPADQATPVSAQPASGSTPDQPDPVVEDDTLFAPEQSEPLAPAGDKIVMVYRGHASEERDLEAGSVDLGPLLTDSPTRRPAAPAAPATPAAPPRSVDPSPATGNDASLGADNLDFGPLVSDTEEEPEPKAPVTKPVGRTPAPTADAPATADSPGDLDFGPLVEEEKTPAPAAPARKPQASPQPPAQPAAKAKPKTAPKPARSADAGPSAPAIAPQTDDLPGSRSTVRPASASRTRDRRREEAPAPSGAGRKLGLIAGALLGLGITVYALIEFGNFGTRPAEQATAVQPPRAPAPAAVERVQKFEASRTAREEAVRDAAKQRFEALHQAQQPAPAVTPPASTEPVPAPVTAMEAETTPAAATPGEVDAAPVTVMPDDGEAATAVLPVTGGAEGLMEPTAPAAETGAETAVPQPEDNAGSLIEDPALHEEDPAEEIGQLPSESSPFDAPAAPLSSEISTEASSTTDSVDSPATGSGVDVEVEALSDPETDSGGTVSDTGVEAGATGAETGADTGL